MHQPLQIDVVRKLVAALALGRVHGSDADADTVYTALTRMWPADGSLEQALASAAAATEFERAP